MKQKIIGTKGVGKVGKKNGSEKEGVTVMEPGDEGRMDVIEGKQAND